MAFNGFEDADSNTGGGGGIYRGLIDLTPTVETIPLTPTVFAGGTAVTDSNNDTVLTPTTLVDTGLGVFMVSATGVGAPVDIGDDLVHQATIVWPDCTLDPFAVCGFAIHNDVPLSDLIQDLGYGVTALVTYSGGVAIQHFTKTLIDGSISNLAAFATPVAGDVLRLTLNQSTGEVKLHTDDNSYNETLAVFPTASMPDATFSLSILYGTVNDASLVPSFHFNMGDDANGAVPFGSVGSIPVTLPSIANDNDWYKCSGAGDILGKTVGLNDYFVVIDNKSSCIVLREPNGISGGGGGTYRGELSLEVGTTLSQAFATNIVGGSVTATVGGVETITIAEMATTNLGGVVNYTLVESDPIYLDRAETSPTVMRMTWPIVPPNEQGYFMLMFTTEGTPAIDIATRLLGVTTGTDMIGVGAITAWVSGSTLISSSSTVSGVGAVTQEGITLPSGDTLVSLSQTGDIQFYWDNGNENSYLGQLPIADIPNGTNIKICVCYFVLSLPSELTDITVGFGVGDGLPPTFQNVVPDPVVLPVDAVDGDYIKASVGGTFGTKTVPTGAYFILISNRTDCIVLLEPNGSAMDDAAVNALILAAIQTGEPLELAVQALIASALASYDDQTGLNVVGDWDATTTTVLLSDFQPTYSLTGSVSGNSLAVSAPISSAASYNFGTSRPNFFGLTDSFNLVDADTWSFDFIMPDMVYLDAAVYIEVAPLTNGLFGSNPAATNYARITYQDGTWSGGGGSSNGNIVSAGDRLRVRLSPIDSTIEVTRVSNPLDPYSQEIYVFSDSFVGDFPIVAMKAAIIFCTYSSSPDIATVTLYGSRNFITLPIGVADKQTYHVTNADEFSQVGGTPLTADDFVTFYNGTQNVAVMRLYTREQIREIAQLTFAPNVTREVGVGNITEGGSSFLMISDVANNNHLLYTSMVLSTTDATTIDDYELKLTSDGDALSPYALTDGLVVPIKVITAAGGDITNFAVTGFYGEAVCNTDITANAVTILTFRLVLNGSSWDWNFISKSVL